MLSFDRTDVATYCRDAANLLDASVQFEIKGNAYETAPTVTISGGGGTGATAHAVVTNGIVTGIVIDTPGTGYTTDPTIAFSGGGGTGAAATSVRTGTTVTGATITNAGGYYLTITDNTAYAAGEARSNVNLTFYDHFAGKVEAQITTTNPLDVPMTGLNLSRGVDGIATVVSDQGHVKDGSIHDLFFSAFVIGNFEMEL